MRYLKSSPNLNRTINKVQNNKHSVFKLGPWPQHQWWCDFNHPGLDDLINQALKHNPNLHATFSMLQKAQQEAIVQRSILFPLIFFDANMTKIYLSQHGLYRAFNPNLI